MLPAMGIPVLCGKTKNVEVLTVSGSTRLLNTSWITAFVGTPPAPFAGLTVATCGRVVSAALPVVNAELPGFTIGLAGISVICAEVTTVYVELAVRGAVGVKVIRLFPSDRAIPPATGTPLKST